VPSCASLVQDGKKIPFSNTTLGRNTSHHDLFILIFIEKRHRSPLWHKVCNISFGETQVSFYETKKQRNKYATRRGLIDSASPVSALAASPFAWLLR